jgi:hypothetical protein
MCIKDAFSAGDVRFAQVGVGVGQLVSRLSQGVRDWSVRQQTLSELHGLRGGLVGFRLRRLQPEREPVECGVDSLQPTVDP